MEDMQNFRAHTQEPEPPIVAEKSTPKSSNMPPTRKAAECKGPQFTSYAPLTVPKAKILQEAFNVDTLPLPRKKPPPANVDGSKDFLYHCNINHATEECHTLCHKIKKLV